MPQGAVARCDDAAHHAAYILYQNGKRGHEPKALQYIMGHANIVMTLNYYAHATFHSAQEEMERLQAKAKPTAEAKPESAAESAEETKAA